MRAGHARWVWREGRWLGWRRRTSRVPRCGEQRAGANADDSQHGAEEDERRRHRQVGVEQAEEDRGKRSRRV